MIDKDLFALLALAERIEHANERPIQVQREAAAAIRELVRRHVRPRPLEDHWDGCAAYMGAGCTCGLEGTQR